MAEDRSLASMTTLSFPCGFPYVGRGMPIPLTRENMAPHSTVLCEDAGNGIRRLLHIEECECPCHEGDEMASTLRDARPMRLAP